MELYEYLIGGKKTGQIDDLKDPMPDSKPFCGLKEGETFFVSHFNPDGTCTYADEIKITSIDKKPTCWVFTGLTKEGEKCTYPMWVGDLNKTLYVWDQRTYYKVFSTFKMDDKPFFELIKKEIKNQMELYEYLIGGKKTGRIDDLKDAMPESKPFCELKTGETFFMSKFKPDGTSAHADEIKITSIRKKPTHWVFTGLTKEGAKYVHSVLTKDLDKKLEVWDLRTYYKVFSTFEMDDKPFFELVKKEIKN